jgi:hypothetical protein
MSRSTGDETLLSISAALDPGMEIRMSTTGTLI